MIVALALLAVAYAGCVAFLRSAIDAAPEAYEDEAGFHLQQQ